MNRFLSISHSLISFSFEVKIETCLHHCVPTTEARIRNISIRANIFMRFWCWTRLHNDNNVLPLVPLLFCQLLNWKGMTFLPNVPFAHLFTAASHHHWPTHRDGNNTTKYQVYKIQRGNILVMSREGKKKSSIAAGKTSSSYKEKE